MATSGTTAFSPDLSELIEEAFERCGAELRSGYDFRTARRSLNFLFADWANRGINLWTVDTGTIAMVDGTATYNLPTDTVDLIEHSIRTGSGDTQADLSIHRISVSSYAAIPNKTAEGRPLNVYVNRQAPTPTVTVWPVPDASSTYTLVYWYLRRIEDAGDGVNTPDVPFRFLAALVAGLAYYLSMKIPGALERQQVLKDQYDVAWQLAADEDREKADLRLVPRLFRV
jgi:hypothetical protein